MRKSLALLIGGSLAIWLALVYPAYLLWGDSAVLFSATAGIVCLVPAVLTLAWCQRALRGTAEQQLLSVLGSTGIRLFIVVAAGMVLYNFHRDFHSQRFWFWLIGFYLVTLTLEVILLARLAQAMLSPRNEK